MAPSPTGPGYWTRASTPAAREKGGTSLLRWSSLLLDSEPQLSQHFNSPRLAALEVARGETLSGSELIGRAQDRFRRVTAPTRSG
jgi:hypothetical protein